MTRVEDQEFRLNILNIVRLRTYPDSQMICHFGMNRPCLILTTMRKFVDASGREHSSMDTAPQFI